jgi:hypothetical protein
MKWKRIDESEGCQKTTTLDLLCKKDAEQLKRFAVEYRTLCESAVNLQSGKFLEISKTKLAIIKKFLAGLCEKDGVVKESMKEGMSRLTKSTCRKIMDMVMKFGWYCWFYGDQMFPWEDAEQDDSRDKLESYLDSLVVA